MPKRTPKQDLKTKTLQYFKEKGVKLRKYELEHLDTYSGIYNASYNFKSWVVQTVKAHNKK